MAVFTDLQIKQWFETGDIPTQQQFFNLIDSKVNVLDLPALLGITINVTAITGGTNQNILFQKAGKVSQDNSFKYYDATKRLAFDTLAPIARVHMYADTNLDPTPLEQVYERPLGVFNSNTNWQRHSSFTNGIRVGFFGLAQQTIGQGTRWSWANTNNTAVPATECMRLSQSKRLSIGNTILDGATCDIFSESSLSSIKDIRVRNSTNTADKFQILGDNSLIGSGSVSWDAMQTHIAGPTVTMNSNVRGLLVNPPLVIAGLTITLPATASIKDGQEVIIIYGGTITTGNVVTGNSVVANVGQTLLTTTALATAKAGDILTYKWIAATNSWYNINK